MESRNITVALDIGTTKVCTLIASSNDQDTEIIGVGTYPSQGLKKGSVVNIDKTVNSIQSSLEEAKLMAGIENLELATIGIAGSHIYCFNSTGVVPIKGKEITAQDVERVLEAAKAVLIPSDRDVLHIIPQEYKVDNTTGIKNPVGMCGSRLEVYVHIVTGKTPSIQNLLKCVELAGIHPSKIVLQPIASSKSVLSFEERDLGVVLIDIGGGTTDVAVWKDGSLVHSQIIPIGGNHFTNDLAVALKVPHTEAERIKINYGSVLNAQEQNNTHVSVQGLTGTKPKEVPVEYITNVLAARAEELFEVVKEIITDKKLDHLITGGYVLTGGGSLIKYLADLAEFNLDKPCKVGCPKPIGSMSKVMQNPKYATVLGLIQEADIQKIKRSKSSTSDKGVIDSWSNSIKSVFREIF